MSISLHEKQRDHKDRISKKFMVVLNYYFEDYFEQNPEEASQLGLKRYDHKIKNHSEEAFQKEIIFNKEVLKKLKLIDPYNLTQEEHVDYLLLKSRVERIIFDNENGLSSRNRVPQLYFPVDGVYCLLFRTMNGVDRLKCVTSRMEQIPKLIEQAKVNLTNPPRIWVDVAIDQIKDIIGFFKALPEVDVLAKTCDENPEMTKAFLQANNHCIWALEDYERFLNVDLIEKAHGEFCVGRQAFDFYLKNDHFVDYTSGYIHELGNEIFNKTQADIIALCKLIDKTKDPDQLIEEIEKEHPPADKLLENYSQLVKRTRDFVYDNKIITFPEEEEVKVLETPKFLRKIIPFAAYYCLGPYEQSNTGQFWVTPVDETDPEKQKELLMSGHNLYRLPSIVLHETYPGHHLQLMIAKKVLFEDFVSTIRRATFNTLFLEGWALYCEQMMGETNFYSDKQKLLMLKQRLWRAARIILDVELHTGRKSINEAISFLVNKLKMSEKFARAEVIRYSMTPTQPLSYEIGRRLINQIRDKEKIRLGDGFSLKDFHDKLLSKGSLPLGLIDALVFDQKAEVTK